MDLGPLVPLVVGFVTLGALVEAVAIGVGLLRSGGDAL
jgi:hypothetical protein